VEASNSCARTLIFGSFLLLSFVKFFFCPFFAFLTWRFIVFSPFLFDFYRPLFSPSFSLLFCIYFFSYVISSLTYPNLVGNKMLGCCCCIIYFFVLSLSYSISFHLVLIEQCNLPNPVTNIHLLYLNVFKIYKKESVRYWVSSF
jgi:hypothetical protein